MNISDNNIQVQVWNKRISSYRAMELLATRYFTRQHFYVETHAISSLCLGPGLSSTFPDIKSPKNTTAADTLNGGV